MNKSIDEWIEWVLAKLPELIGLIEAVVKFIKDLIAQFKPAILTE